MGIPSPFHLVPNTGQLSLYGLETKLGPRLSLSDFEESDIFASVTKVKSSNPDQADAFQIKSITLPDGRWAYLRVEFRSCELVRIGFGWGKTREYGFHELTAPEFQEQLHAYCAWLESLLGPSLPCVGAQAYRQELSWGKIEASRDWRTQLAGIGILYGPSLASAE